MAAEQVSPTLIKPDLDFVRILKEGGGDTLQKCFQCSTCTVTCKLSPDREPFPRKEMIWAQWGLKNRLLADPDVWLCEQCNDCSVQCPRGARPGDVMAAVRAQAIRRYAWPRFLGEWVGKPKFFALLAAIPFLLGVLYSLPPGPEGEFNLSVIGKSGPFVPFEQFLSHGVIYGVFVPLTVFLIAAVVTGVKRFWNDLTVVSGPRNANLVGTAVLEVLWEAVTHQQLRKCEANRRRYVYHVLIFYGFLGLMITTAAVIVGLYGFGWKLPWGLTQPHWVCGIFKVLGNLSGFALVAGFVLLLIDRLRDGEDVGRSLYFDWLFLLVLGAVGLTGLLTQYSRLVVPHGALPYVLYAVHLEFVFFLLAYFPFSKFAHLIYHLTAKVHAKVYDRYDERPA